MQGVKLIEAFESADNTYRTKNYIVTQSIGIRTSQTEGAIIYSHDTFYKRSEEADYIYENAFYFRKNVNGRRICVRMSTRQYVE